MKRSSLVLLAAALAVPACGQGAPKEQKKTAEAEAPAPEQEAPKEVEKPVVDKWQKKLDSRVLADSGLGVGGKLSAFDIINCDTGDEYCQVCKYGSSPKIMAVGTPDDEAFRKDLQDLDAIVKKYGEDKVKAFAVVTDIKDGKAPLPADAAAAQATAKKLKDELRITMPVVIPAAGDDGGNKVWTEYYNVTRSRTVMFADGRNKIHFSAVGPEDWSGLDTALKKVLDEGGEATAEAGAKEKTQQG